MIFFKTKDALRAVQEALRTAGEHYRGVSVWITSKVAKDLIETATWLEGREGGSEAAKAIREAVRIYAEGNDTAKSWKQVRIELEDAEEKLEAVVLDESIRKAPEGLTLNGVFSVLTGVENDGLKECNANLKAERADLCGKLFRADEEVKRLNELVAELQGAPKGGVGEAWWTVCDALHQRLPNWNDDKNSNAAENAGKSIQQMADEILTLKGQSQAWEAVYELIGELVPNPPSHGTGEELVLASIRSFAHDAKASRTGVESWRAVYSALEELAPGFNKDGRVREAAVETIKDLATKAKDWEEAEAAFHHFYPGWRTNGLSDKSKGNAARITLANNKKHQENLRRKIEAASMTLKS